MSFQIYLLLLYSRQQYVTFMDGVITELRWGLLKLHWFISPAWEILIWQDYRLSFSSEVRICHVKYKHVTLQINCVPIILKDRKNSGMEIIGLVTLPPDWYHSFLCVSVLAGGRYQGHEYVNISSIVIHVWNSSSRHICPWFLSINFIFLCWKTSYQWR